MRRAITLVEVLIVIAIIAVLAAITVGAFNGVKNRAKTALCAANQRQIALGTLLYSQDFNEVMPRGTGEKPWATLVEPYLKCRLIELQCPVYRRGEYGTMAHYAVGYAMNGCLLEAAGVPSIATTVMLSESADVKFKGSTEFGPIILLWRPDSLTFNSNCEAYGIPCEVRLPFGATRHQGEGNYVFVDTHLDLLRPDVLRYSVDFGGKDPCPIDERLITGSQGSPSFPIL